MKFLDDTDGAIIAKLQYDSRTLYTEIASDLELSESSVRRRVKRLLLEGLIQIVDMAEPMTPSS